MSDTKLALAVLQQISDFLARLPEDQLQALADGRAKISFVGEGEDRPRPTGRSRTDRTTTPVPDMSELRDKVLATGNRDAAESLLKPMPKPTLVNLAKFLEVARASSINKDLLVEGIVARTVGSLLTSSAYHGYSA